MDEWMDEYMCGKGGRDMDNVLHTISSQVTFKYNRWVF